MSETESKATKDFTTEDRDDDDDDDDRINSSHRIFPNVSSSNPKENQSRSQSFHVPTLIKNDVKAYLNTPIPKDYSSFVQCHIKREKEGLTKAFSTTFSLYFDGENTNDQTVLLTARKTLTAGGHSEYYIGSDTSSQAKNLNDENSIAKLRSVNLVGSEFILYQPSNNQQNKSQAGAILYDEHLFGSTEPRKFTVLLNNGQKNVSSLQESEPITDAWRAGRLTDCIELKNKTPTYNEESKTYTVTIQGDRIKQASHKNFQLITSNGDHKDDAVMQFGRIDDNNFALDYRYPLTAVQAFAIALTSFHNRFRT